MPLVTPNHMQGTSRITLDEHMEHGSSGNTFDEWDLSEKGCDLERIQLSGAGWRNNCDRSSLTPCPSTDAHHRFIGHSNVYHEPSSAVSTRKAAQFRHARWLLSQTPIHLRDIQRNLLATLSRNTQKMANADNPMVTNDKEKCNFHEKARTTAGRTENQARDRTAQVEVETDQLEGALQSESGGSALSNYSDLEGHTKDHRTIFSAKSFEFTAQGVEVSPSPYKSGRVYDFEECSEEERPISPIPLLPMTTTDQDLLFDCETLESSYDKPIVNVNSGAGPTSSTFPRNLDDFGLGYSNNTNCAASRMAPPTTFPRPTKSKRRTTPSISRAEKSSDTARTACIKFRYYRTTKTMAQSFLLRHFNNNNDMTLEQLASLPTPPGQEVEEL